MSRIAGLLLLRTLAALAQPQSTKVDLLRLTDELQAAMNAGDWRKATVLSGSLKAAVREARDQSLAAGAGDLEDSILNWLPADTETLVMARQPFTIPEADPTKVPSALAMAQAYVLGHLASAEGEKLYKALQGRTIRLAALAARKFENHHPDQRNALPLGMIAYQGCAIYTLADRDALAALSREPDESVRGHAVWSSKGSQNDWPQSDTYLITQVHGDSLLVCNDRDFFTEVVSRMAAPQKPRALPPALPEWKQLDRTAPLWAIRHYDPKRANVDPTLMPQLLLSSINPEASGLIMEFGLTGGGVRARMLSFIDPWQGLARNREFYGAAQSREVTPGVWELTVAGKPEAAGMASFALMAVLGFAVLL